MSAKLDLYSGRQPHTIEIEYAGEKLELKVPVAFTAEEIERFLEAEAELGKSKDGISNIKIVFSQLTIVLQRYQPDITEEKTKKYFSLLDAEKILNFIKENSLLTGKDEPELKKKALKKG